MTTKETTANRDIYGAAIVEMLIAVPLIFVFLAGTVEVGRLINQGAYLKVMTFNAALVGAGVSNLSGTDTTIQRANDQYQNNSSVRQVSVPLFQADFDDENRIIRVDYGANLNSIFPRTLTVGGMKGEISLPYLSSAQNSGLGEEPVNDSRGKFCADGSVEASWGCGPQPAPPSCTTGVWQVYCGNNRACVPVARTIKGTLTSISSISAESNLANCADLRFIEIEDSVAVEIDISNELVVPGGPPLTGTG